MKKTLAVFCIFSSFLFSSREDSLEFYLSEHNANIREGYMTEEQRAQFSECLNNYTGIKKILEIGLNAGHSAENFFKRCPDLELFVSFDINRYDYTKYAFDYFSQKYGDRFLFVEGDSAITVPQFSQQYPDLLFDLIYVDGCHLYEYAMKDVVNAKSLAHPGTILWIDDVNGNEVKAAVFHLLKLRVIKEPTIHYANGRAWAETQYDFSLEPLSFKPKYVWKTKITRVGDSY